MNHVAFLVALVTLAVVPSTTRGEQVNTDTQQLDACHKWRHNYLDLGRNKDMFVQLQPNCYEFSYTTITSTTNTLLPAALQPVTLRVANGCAYETTTTKSSVEYAPALTTLVDFFDFAAHMCVGTCPEDPTIAAACQVTYTELYASFIDPVTGGIGGVLPYQIPEWINVTMDDAIVFYISNFTALDCVAENMITENSVSNNCTGGGDSLLLQEDETTPDTKQDEMPSGQVCNNWQNTALGLLMAKASWYQGQPDCYQFTYTRSTSNMEPIEETRRVANGTAVNVTTPAAEQQQGNSSIWPVMNTISDIYDFAAMTCGTDTCPQSGPYNCTATYTTHTASTANEANGWFGAIFSFEIPESIYIDMHHGIANDDVTYRITAYQGLDCEAEGYHKTVRRIYNQYMS